MGMSIKQSWKSLISFCTNDLQKERGTEGLLYILELFVLTVTNSSSLENVVTQDFDASCTSWPAMLLSAVVILYWSIYGCTLAPVSAQVRKRVQLARYAHVHPSHISDCCVDARIIWTGSFSILTFILKAIKLTTALKFSPLHQNASNSNTSAAVKIH